MPLQPLNDDEPREELHQRDLIMRAYRRSNGLFDIEGRISDRKLEDFTIKTGKVISAMDYIHDMSIRVTIDVDYNVVEASASTDASPYPICPKATGELQRLLGTNMSRGWTREVRAKLGGVEGCTHLMDLLIGMGTVAYQTLIPYRRHAPLPTNEQGVPVVIDSCLGHAADGEAVAMLWPQYARPPKQS